jgi:hypothetical protein
LYSKWEWDSKKTISGILQYSKKNLPILNIKIGAGGRGRSGSGWAKMMRLLAARLCNIEKKAG